MQILDNYLTEDIEERQTILFEIERTLFTQHYKLSQKHFEIFSVQSIAMIYSVWEGFVNQSFRAYIDRLNSLNLEFCNLVDSIQVFHMENIFKQFNEYPCETRKKAAFFSRLDVFFLVKKQRLFPLINSHSNVGYEEINRLLTTFNLQQFNEFWGKYKHPNSSLKESLNSFLRFRNGIAHGADLSSEEKVTQEVFVKYRILVIDLMYEIRSKMLFGFSTQCYLKSHLPS